MARPQKEIKRDRQVCIKFTGAELDEVDTRVAAAGTSLSEYGRTCMLARRNAPAHDLVTVEALKEQRLIHVQLRRLGNLLNQMVRHMHQTGQVLPDAADILKELRTIISGRSMP